MKKLYPVVAILACILASGAKPINVGTETPVNEAEIGLTGTNKTVLIHPVAGTLNIVDLKGTLMDDQVLFSSTPTDRITYIITTSVPGFTRLEFPCYKISEEITNVLNSTGGFGKTQYSDFSFSKPWDKNSQSFSRIAAIPTVQTSIEIKLYAPGAVTPYISYKLKNIVIKSFQTGGTNVNDPYMENIIFSFENYGFKDWGTNVSFGFNMKTGGASAY